MTIGKITIDNSVRNVRSANSSKSKHVTILSKEEDPKPDTRQKNVSQNKLQQKKEAQ